MKNQIKMMALLAVFGLAASSCTKENVVYDTEVLATAHTVTYIVDGRQYYDNPQTEEEWSLFLDRMVALAEEGYTVQFWRGDVQTSATKEKSDVLYPNPSRGQGLVQPENGRRLHCYHDL